MQLALLQLDTPRLVDIHAVGGSSFLRRNGGRRMLGRGNKRRGREIGKLDYKVKTKQTKKAFKSGIVTITKFQFKLTLKKSNVLELHSLRQSRSFSRHEVK